MKAKTGQKICILNSDEAISFKVTGILIHEKETVFCPESFEEEKEIRWVKENGKKTKDKDLWEKCKKQMQEEILDY